MQIIGGDRLRPTNLNSPPTVVLIAGNNKIGAYTLCTARHLTNHQVQTIVYLLGNEPDLVNTVSYQRKIYLPTGGSLCTSPHDLPPHSLATVDLIVDGLLGATQPTLLDLSTEFERVQACEAIAWSNASRARILCLDVPSGVHPVTGIPASPAHHIVGRWTLAFGLPKASLALVGREIAGDLFLADIGIPRIVFQKLRAGVAGVEHGGVIGGVGGAGLDGFRKPLLYIPPFGDKYLVGIRIAE
ncbi:YjeF N-terminal domain-containing protein [Chytriomyces sp. MP71]|nr:YjeF N-terminal domain-containing protein [Chytriomyces sp. MP71]